jgi:hypothetical protein
VAHISVSDAQAYATPRKLDLGTSLDGDLENSVATQVLAQLHSAYNTTTWVDESTTPVLVQSIIGMYYVAWYYQRTYAEDTGTATYADRLLRWAQMLINGILNGNTVLVDVVTPATGDRSEPAFYPNDQSSATKPENLDINDPERGSVGPAYFTMGQVF